jgi:hypothetical protein
MLMMDLHSSTIDKVGIWQGMSGSPVYASDHRLIGAVSYGLGVGPSTIAGVTPAADMQKLLTATPGPAPGATRARVPLPRALVRRIVRLRAATPAQARQGMTEIPVPFTLSGLTPTRLRQVAPVLDLGRVKLADTPGSQVSAEPIDVTAGGNLAASLAYGTVNGTALGTATMVCGNEVVGFGHPFTNVGPTTLGMHGARAVLIQDDPTVAGFKVANVGAPVGRIDADRLVGIHGVKGAAPASAPMTAVATNGNKQTSGTTHVEAPDVIPDAAFANMYAVEDRALDQVSGGTAAAQWTIKGLRKSGAPFTFRRQDLYADPADISSAPAIRLAEDLIAIIGNEGEVVRITSVRSDTHFRAPYETYVISKVQARMFGRWIPVTSNKPVPLRAGTTARLKVFMTSRVGAPRTLVVSVPVPTHAAGHAGTLHVVGGNSDTETAEEFFADGADAFADAPGAPSAATLPALLKALVAGPHHNQVQATLRFGGAPGSARVPRTGRATMDRVVSGDLSAPVVALR